MSIATEKTKQASERFLLVRLNPARHVTPSTVGGGFYEIVLPFIPNRLERNGAVLTKVTTATNNDEWQFTEGTMTLRVKLATAPNGTTNILVCFYYLFYTGTVYRSISEDPEDDATPTREWEPKITTYPTVLQSFENVQYGVFTISDTTLELINEDGAFQEFLGESDSFFNKQVDIWLCISDVSNIQKIFTGTVQGLELTQNTVQLQLVDSFQKLQAPALMGDSPDECYLNREAASYPDVSPKDVGLPVRYHFGKTSRYQTKVRTDAPTTTFQYDIDDSFAAACTSFSATVSGTTNRTWTACRQGSSVPTQSFGSLTAVATSGDYRFFNFASLSNVEIGDTLKWVDAGTWYGRVTYVGSFTYSSNPYNVAVFAAGSTLTLSAVVSPLKSFFVRILQPADVTTPEYFALYDQDYTITETATTGGNTLVEIVFDNNFESAITRLDLDPTTDEVFYRTSLTTVDKHGMALETICETVGLPVNSTTFTAADTALPVNVKFSIPNFDEDDFDTYLKYVQDVLKSTLGFLKINSSFEVEYYLLEAPTSSVERNSFLMLGDSSKVTVNYLDIVTKIIGYNPHNDSGDAVILAQTPTATAESKLSEYLHGRKNVDRFRHVLEELTSKITDHINLKSERAVKYIFSTATEDMDTELGDDLEINNRIVLGSSNVQDVKVVTIEKSPSRVTIEAQDLKGL